MGFSAPDLEVFRRSQRLFEEIGAYRNEYCEISGEGTPERVTAARVSASVFPMLGAEPELGRLFTDREDAPGWKVVLLSHGLWQRRYGADRSIVGRTIRIDRQPYTVTGVMPKNFEFPLPGPQDNYRQANLWVPMAFTPAELQAWGEMYTNSVLARLRPDVTFEQARGEAQALSSAIEANYPPPLLQAFQGADIKVGVNPFHEEVVGPVRTPLLVLMTAVSLVLLIVCANVATLLVSRAASRQREIAIRKVLGATRARLVRQVLTESLLLALAGGTLGFLFTFWAKDLLLVLVPQDVPLPHDIPIGGGVLAFVVAMSCLTAVLFGLAPTFQASATSLHGSLQEGGRSGTPGRGRHQLQGIFVTIEFASALVLLMGAGLLIRSFAKLLETNLGFRPDHVLTLNLPLPSEPYPKAARIRQFYEQLLEGTGNLPEVRDAGLASDLPLNSGGTIGIQIEGDEKGSTPQAISPSWVLGNYFQTMGIPILKGRSFTLEDRMDAQPVAIVSQAMARQLWPGQDPVGKRVRWGLNAPWQTIVEIAGDVNDKPLGQPVQMHIYTPYLQLADRFLENNTFGRAMNLAVRTRTDPASLTSAVVGQVRLLDPNLAIADIRTMTQVISSSVAGRRFNAFLLGTFSGVALFLAAIGIYGVLSFTVAQQIHEIGIRLALGAEPRNVFRLVLGRGMRLAGLGAAIGLATALAFTRLMAALLYGISATDPITFAGVVILLLSVALVACYLPARKASRLDPMVALRYE